MFVNFMKPVMALFLIASGWSAKPDGDSIGEPTRAGVDGNSNIQPVVNNDASVAYDMPLPVTVQSVRESDDTAGNLGGGTKTGVQDNDGGGNIESVKGEDINTSTSSSDSNKSILEDIDEGPGQVLPKLDGPAEPKDQTMAGEYIKLYSECKHEVPVSEVACALLSSRDSKEAANLINLLAPFKKEHVIDLSYILSVAVEKFSVECIPDQFKELVNKLYLEMGLESIPETEFPEEEVMEMKLGGIYLATHVDQ